MLYSLQLAALLQRQCDRDSTWGLALTCQITNTKLPWMTKSDQTCPVIQQVQHQSNKKEHKIISKKYMPDRSIQIFDIFKITFSLPI